MNLSGVIKPLQIIHETTPFLRLKGWKAVGLAAQAHLGGRRPVPATLCPLVDFRGWREYFHWFLDFLPRVFVTEHHHRTAGAEVRFLVPVPLEAWRRNLWPILASPRRPCSHIV